MLRDRSRHTHTVIAFARHERARVVVEGRWRTAHEAVFSYRNVFSEVAITPRRLTMPPRGGSFLQSR